MPEPELPADNSPIEDISESPIQRSDQLMLGLSEELCERAWRVHNEIGEGNVQEAYEALQEAVSTIAELMTGFRFLGAIERRPISPLEGAGEYTPDEEYQPPTTARHEKPSRPVVYTRHARERMNDEERGVVTEDEVEEVLENPSVSYVGVDGKPNVRGEVNGKRIRVCYMEEESRRLIITVINQGSTQ